MPWIPLGNRSSEIKDLLEQVRVIQQPNISSDDFYNSQDFGLLDSAQLLSMLFTLLQGTPSLVKNVESGNQLSQPTSFSVEQPVISESEAYQVRSLSWLQHSARTPEDRAYAERCYRKLLFDLWRKHVASTGQTYYPSLRDDLEDAYESLLNDHFN